MLMLFLQLLLSMNFSCNNQQEKTLQLTIVPDKTVWKDTTDMNFNIKLTNISTTSIAIFDQILDELYNFSPSDLDNTEFSIQHKEGTSWVDYRYISSRQVLIFDLKSGKELLDSVARTRNCFINLKPKDCIYFNYSFRYSTGFQKGEYRIRAQFKYGYEKNDQVVLSDWAYFTLQNPIEGLNPLRSFRSSPKFFWQ